MTHRIVHFRTLTRYLGNKATDVALYGLKVNERNTICACTYPLSFGEMYTNVSLRVHSCLNISAKYTLLQFKNTLQICKILLTGSLFFKDKGTRKNGKITKLLLSFISHWILYRHCLSASRGTAQVVMIFNSHHNVPSTCILHLLPRALNVTSALYGASFPRVKFMCALWTINFRSVAPRCKIWTPCRDNASS